MRGRGKDRGGGRGSESVRGDQGDRRERGGGGNGEKIRGKGETGGGGKLRKKRGRGRRGENRGDQEGGWGREKK